MSRTSREAKAASIMADLFSFAVLRRPESEILAGQLYAHERQALEWLREWRQRDAKTPICSWTAHYIKFGPPPWEKRGLSLRGAE